MFKEAEEFRKGMEKGFGDAEKGGVTCFFDQSVISAVRLKPPGEAMEYQALVAEIINSWNDIVALYTLQKGTPDDKWNRAVDDARAIIKTRRVA